MVPHLCYRNTPLPHSPKQATKFSWGRQSGAWGGMELRICLGGVNFAWVLLGVTRSLLVDSTNHGPYFIVSTKQISQFITASFFRFPNILDIWFENKNYLGFSWGLLWINLELYDTWCSLLVVYLGLGFLMWLLGEVIFRVIFAWGHQFWHLFLLGVLLGVGFSGAVRKGCGNIPWWSSKESFFNLIVILHDFTILIYKSKRLVRDLNKLDSTNVVTAVRI